MERFPIIIQSGGKGIDHETLSQIKTHAMVTHLRQKAKRNAEAEAEAQGGSGSTATSSSSSSSHHQLEQTIQAPVAFSDNSLKVVQFRPNAANRRNRIKQEPKIRKERKARAKGKAVAKVKASSEAIKTLSPRHVADVANLCGSQPLDGIPPEISRRISRAFKHRKPWKSRCHR